MLTATSTDKEVLDRLVEVRDEFENAGVLCILHSIPMFRKNAEGRTDIKDINALDKAEGYTITNGPPSLLVVGAMSIMKVIANEFPTETKLVITSIQEEEARRASNPN